MWKLKISEGGDDKWLRTVNNHIGRQHWVFDPDAGSPEEIAEVERLRQEFTRNRFHVKQSSDLLMRMQLTKENPRPQIPPAHRVEDGEKVTEEAVTATMRRGVGFYSSIQADDGHWPAESAGPTFFLPPMVIVLYVTGELNTVLTSEHQKEIIRYTYNHQNEDGGWGFHIEGHSTMFGTVLSYVILRLLGQQPSDGDVENAMTKAKKWILARGGAIGTPSWGKFWITLLGVYDWDGCNPIPPEFLLLSNSFPVHPGKMLCYCRLVYIPMSYLYGKKFVGPITDLVRSIRQELYTEPYDKINWNKARNTCAKEDLYYPHPAIQDMAWGFLHNVAEPFFKLWPFSWVREKAMKVAMEHIHYEDENSRYLCIGCVEKILSLMACWVEDPNSDAYKLHLARLPDYLWLAEDGLKFQSFGSQMWDAAFSIQAILSGNISHEYSNTIRKAHDFLKATQMREDPPGNFSKMHRHLSKGGWPFSIQDHGWQVSDCTAEGLKAALLLSQMPSDLVGSEFELQNLQDSVNIIISLQSPCGGLPAWEPQKAFRWMEYFNPTEFFEDVMIEKEYVECTSSAIQALVLFKKLHPQHRKKEIEICISKAIDYIENNQNSDGSWYGCWGICYTYGTWFGIKGLTASGRNYHNSSTVRKACHFLLSKQLEDGGWGESYHSCTDMVYTNLENNQSNLVQTSWALMSLIDAGQTKIDPEPVKKGIRLLINSQMQDGDFPQQSITGIFMKNCTLNYSAYRNIFPIWALGEYRKRVLFA